MKARQSSASSPRIWGERSSIWWSCSGESIRWSTVRIFQYSKEPTSVKPVGYVSKRDENEVGNVLRTFLMQAFVQESTSDGAGILMMIFE